MWSRFKSSFIADFNIIWNDKALLSRYLAPIVFIVFLRFIFPLISAFVFSKTGFSPGNYYSLIAITLVSTIPMLIGIVYAFILLDENNLNILHVITIASSGRSKYLIHRIIVTIFVSFVLTIITILLVNPVPNQGWLRIIFATFLISIQAPFVFLFISAFTENRITGLAFSRLLWIILIALPLGLQFHHPWNYFAFFSPLYWTAWAWIVQSPVESMIYGSIALITTSTGIIVFYRHLLRKHID